jgi:CRP/FNR family transcriptional regulator, dissimilatory nitrate respiration regulator
MSVFERLPLLAKAGTPPRDLATGEALFQPGDPATEFYEVESGLVRLLLHTSEGRDIVAHVARPGDLIAEAALFADHHRCAAVAARPSRVRCYDRRAVMAALEVNPQVALDLIEGMAAQVRALRANLEIRHLRNAHRRVLQHVAAHAGPDGGRMPLDGSLKDLAALLGLTHETLYRTLSKLERDGVIARDAQAITLKKPGPYDGNHNSY